MSIGDKIRQLRKGKEWNQKDLAELLQTSRPTISNWETGRTSPDHEALRQMANLFGVSVDYILGEEGESGRTVGEQESFIITAKDLERLKKLQKLSGEDQAMFDTLLEHFTRKKTKAANELPFSQKD